MEFSSSLNIPLDYRERFSKFHSYTKRVLLAPAELPITYCIQDDGKFRVPVYGSEHFFSNELGIKQQKGIIRGAIAPITKPELLHKLTTYKFVTTSEDKSNLDYFKHLRPEEEGPEAFSCVLIKNEAARTVVSNGVNGTRLSDTVLVGYPFYEYLKPRENKNQVVLFLNGFDIFTTKNGIGLDTSILTELKL